ncbi:unnamed protein product [Chironomus riparius]|uniref:Uncharacterized protein n=1 Tax=Chironomus riparius TaxID=315576 RepID=A0A9N9RP53_9DIPT|nr:unnamed protein product [Chironomus riparius]
MEDQIKSQVRNSFTKLKNAIDLREKLLLRQLDAFMKFSQKTDLSEVNFMTANEEDILDVLRQYGSYQNIESFLPFLENDDEDDENCKDVKCLTTCNFLDNKLLSESIINLTVKESHDLISKSSDLKMKTDDLVSQVQQKLKIILPTTKQSDIDKTNNHKEVKDIKSIKQKDVKVKESEPKLKRNSGASSSKKKVLKNISNLTLNSCGSGNIIIKNISNLTINTCKTESENEARICKDTKNCEIFYPQCDFYEKLISENEALKKTIVQQSVNCTTYPDPITAVCMSPKIEDIKNDGTYSINSVSNETSASSLIDEAEDGYPAITKVEKTRKSEIGYVEGESPIEEVSTRTMHLAENFIGTTTSPIIQCWLNKMCLETELENNIEILEFSNIVS